MSKDEIERLLRHGAYEIFKEDKAGEGDKLSNEFVEQDIDAILARRSRTIVHDNTGTNSSAAGGTFSKASFKAKSPDPHSKEGGEEVDVDDPDFWQKFFKDVPEENEQELHKGRRRKRNQDYCERAYAEKFERTLLEAGDDDDDDSIESMDLHVDGIRLAWGGLQDYEWRKADVETTVKYLCTYGYCNGVTTDRISSLALKDKHSVNEIRRMMWSIVLLSLAALVEDDAESMLRREAKNSEKETPPEGVLASTKTKSTTEIKELKDKSLQKFIAGNRWLDVVFKDANSYANSGTPKTARVTSLVGLETDHPKVRALAGASNGTENDADVIFAKEVWPQLELHGWKSELSNGKTSFVHPASKYTVRHLNCSAIVRLTPLI